MHIKRSSSNKKGGAEVLLIGCLLIVLLVVGGAVLAAGYFGLIPAVSKILGTNKPRDLGVNYANIDVMKVHAITGAKTAITKVPAGTGNDMGLLFEGEKPAKYSLTSEELTALANSPWKYFPFSNVQVKMGQDGVVETSAILRTDRLIGFAKALNFSEKDINTAIQGLKVPISNTPVYAKGQFSVVEGKAQINVQAAEIGKFPLPASLVEKFTPQVTEAVDSLINSFPGFHIKNLSFAQGKMNFEGTVPAKQTLLSE